MYKRQDCQLTIIFYADTPVVPAQPASVFYNDRFAGRQKGNHHSQRDHVLKDYVGIPR
jgi:hypothetical protein